MTSRKVKHIIVFMYFCSFFLYSQEKHCITFTDNTCACKSCDTDYYAYTDIDVNKIDTIHYTQKEFKQIEKFVNVEKVNQYFVERLNKERAELGLSSDVRIDSTLIKAAKIRSNELAAAKRISHKRPDKTEYWTVFEKVDKSLMEKYSFENILKVSISNEAQMISEKFIANYFFDSWKESPEHWEFMIDPELRKIGVNFSFGSSDDTNFLVQINYGVLFGMR